MKRATDDFLDILDGFYEQLSESGAVLFPGCYDRMRAAARRITGYVDLHYLPGVKVTQLMADLVNVVAGIAAEGWLSAAESEAQFETMTAKESPLVQTFIMEAEMERARYEPVMLGDAFETPLEERNAILAQRFKRMLVARQACFPLPEDYIACLQRAGERIQHAECFARYRPGPLLQLYDDMIAVADDVASHEWDLAQGVAMIEEALADDAALWKRYRHKAPRFAARPGDPLHDGSFPKVRANMLYLPDLHRRPRLH
jgi:hypothetical protein